MPLTRNRGIPVPHLRAWREWRGLSQSELARRSGVGRVSLWQLETGRMRASRPVVRVLAWELGCPPEVLAAYPPDHPAAYEFAVRREVAAS
jgi:transcriptional regulator with XRE-family HTH domain